MKMKITKEFSPELVNKITDGIMENFPEASGGCALTCVNWKYADCIFKFRDGESGKSYQVGRNDLNKAFPKMFTDKWPKRCTTPKLSDNWDDWNDWLCQADAQDFDAFAQLACLGEVIYG